MPITNRMNRALLILASGGLLFASGAEAAQKVSKPKAAPVQQEMAADGLDGQTLFQYMLGEIAAARGQPIIAAQAYMEMARRLHNADVDRRATELALLAQQGAWALEAVHLWVADEPNSARALQTLAFIQANGMGKLDEVEQTLSRLLTAHPEVAPDIFMQSHRLLGNFPDKVAVAASVERLTAMDLKLPEAYAARALALQAADRRKEAEAAARQALALRPDWEFAASLVAQVAPSEDATKVMEELGEFGRRHPMARDARLGYMRWLANVSRNADAKAAYTKLLEDFPHDDDLAFSVIVAAVKQGDHATAEPQLRRLIADHYREADLLRLQLGQELEANGRDKEARTEYEMVVPGKYYVAARTAIAQLLNKQGKIEEARGVLEQAALVAPDQASAFARVEAALLSDAGRLKEAQTVLEALLATKPDDTEVLYDSAMLAERLQRIEVMETRLRHLIKLQPEHAQAYNALGYTFADRNIRLDEAETLLNRAISLAPEDPAILDSMGWLYYRKGLLPQAIDYLQRSYAKLKDPEVAAHLVQALWDSGRHAEAQKLLKESRAAHPGSPVLVELGKRYDQ